MTRKQSPHLGWFALLMGAFGLTYAAVVTGIELSTPRERVEGVIVGQFIERPNARRPRRGYPCPRIEYVTGGRTRILDVHRCDSVLDAWRIGQRVRVAVSTTDPSNAVIDEAWYSRWLRPSGYFGGGLLAIGFFFLLRWYDKHRAD